MSDQQTPKESTPDSDIEAPPCDNCGQSAIMVGSHPEAGRCYVCGDCWKHQGYSDLKPWDYWRNPTFQHQRAEAFLRTIGKWEEI